MTNPESMVERVAEALYETDFSYQDKRWRDKNWPRMREAFLALARAAIGAMREPTVAMLQPACKSHTPGQPMRPQPDEWGRGAEECRLFHERRRIWASMISTALSEPVERAAGASG